MSGGPNLERRLVAVLRRYTSELLVVYFRIPTIPPMLDLNVRRRTGVEGQQ